MKATIRSHAAAAMLLLAPVATTFVAAPVAAQTQPVINNMSLNSDHGLSPGATLRVQVYATPGGRNASVLLGNSGISIPVREQSAGNYTGSHVIRQGQHVDPTQLMTPRIQYGGYIYSRNFYYPPAFQALAMGSASGSANAPRVAIEQFNMRSVVGDPAPGAELRFRLIGDPGGRASLDIPGVANNIELRETRPGVYTGTYVVRQRDDPDAIRRAVATLRKGDQHATARVNIRDWDEERASGPVRLDITSHTDRTMIDISPNTVIEGRTAPGQEVRVRVDATPNVPGPMGNTRNVYDQNVRADRDGRFTVTVNPYQYMPMLPPGSRLDVRMTAGNGQATAEERITLIQRFS